MSNFYSSHTSFFLWCKAFGGSEREEEERMPLMRRKEGRGRERR
jgi:hypothetical protein